MSLADKIFKDMCRDIIDNGVDTKGEKVRPTWADTGEKAYTVKVRRCKQIRFKQGVPGFDFAPARQLSPAPRKCCGYGRENQIISRI